MRSILVALVVILVLGAVDARACSMCGCGDPLLSSSDPAAIGGTLRLQLDTEFMRVDAGTDGQPGYTDQLTQWSFRLNAVLRPIRELAFSATLPVVNKTIHTVGEGTDVADSRLTGLGDIELSGRYAFLRVVDPSVRRVQELAVSAGTSFPTGGHNATVSNADGSLLLVDPHGQLGTGGWGPFAGLHYWYEQGNWLGFASVSYRLRTEASYFDGSRYKFGDALLFSLHGQYRPIPQIAIDLGIDGRHAWADRAADVDVAATAAVETTGGTLLAAAPGVYANPGGALWLFARGQIPFYKHLYGEQDVKPSVTVGIQYQLL